MNKNELAGFLEESCDDIESNAQAERVVGDVIDIIFETLEEGEDVVIPPLGKLEVKVQKARDARNPATGATIRVEEKNVVKFKPSSKLKEAVA